VTTIAYRDGLLAADTATFIHEGNTRMPDRSKKIRRLSDGSLIAGSGIARQVGDFAAWYETREGSKPDIEHATIIRISKQGTITIYDGKADERDVTDCPFYACGSGAMAALAAMYMGARADQAVEIAMKIDPWTGGEVEMEKI
jgi:ATP-dependent protease HslVU (ClpYQ) peptidase subunit